MENMPYQDRPDQIVAQTQTATQVLQENDWQSGLPVKVGAKVSVRELRLSDAHALFAMLSTEEVSRFISPPPTTLEGFERLSSGRTGNARKAATPASRSFRTAPTTPSASSIP